MTSRSRTLTVSRQDVQRATDEDGDPWAVSNGLLYRLCRQYLDHRNASGVTAKMLLIGRAYAAAAERGRSGGSAADSSGDEFYVRDLPRALRASPIDATLRPLRRMATVTDQNVGQIVEAHFVLMAELSDLTGLEKRALASKYLHFHLPRLYFIFDSRAERMIRKVAGAREPSSKRARYGGDPQYALFVVRALALREQLQRRFGLRLTPRQLDRVLLALEAKERK